MKKVYLIIILLISSNVMHGMEAPAVYTYNTAASKIILRQGAIHDESIRARVRVIGVNEQKRLQKPNARQCYAIGAVVISQDAIIRIENENNNDVLDAMPTFTTELWKNAYDKKVTGTIFKVLEPHVSYYKFRYNAEKNSVEHNCIRYMHEQKDCTIDRAKKDLGLCYSNVLEKAAAFLSNASEKSIAFSSLSVKNGFPKKEAAHVAVTTTWDFVENHPYAYDVIEFIVNAKELIIYKNLLDAYYGEKK